MTRPAKVLGWLALVLLGVPLLLLVLVSLPPVTGIVGRRLLPRINEQLNGRLDVAGFGGSLLTRLELRGVTLRDPEGEVVLAAERVGVKYDLWDLLHSRISLGPVVLDKPIVRLLKGHPGEQYSLLRVVASEDTAAGEPATVDLTITSLELHDGTVFATVWREPADPQREGAQPLDTLQFHDVNLRVPLLRYASAPGTPRVALLEIDTASGWMPDPLLELRELRGEAELKGDSLVIALHAVALPASRLSVEAWLVTDSTRRRFDATAHVDELVAADVRSFITGAEIPEDWRFRGDIRTTSLSSGDVLIQGRNLDLQAAGGTVTGQVTLIGGDNEWSPQNSRLEVAGVEIEQLLDALDVQSDLRATIAGVLTADGRAGTADLRIAGAGGYGVRGTVRGHIVARGNFDALNVRTELTGAAGDLALSGDVATGRHVRLSNVRGSLRRFDLAAIHARLPASSLNAELAGSVVFGSMPREGNVRLFLDSSVVRGVRIDTAAVIASVADGLLTLDSLLLRAPGLHAAGAGTFGLHKEQSGDLTLTLDAPSLGEVEPLVAAFTHDTVVDLAGAVHVAVTAQGSLNQYSLEAQARGADVAVNGFAAESFEARARGAPAAFAWEVQVVVDSTTRVAAAGRRSDTAIVADELTIERADGTWRAQGAAWPLDSVTLTRDPGPGTLTIAQRTRGAFTIAGTAIPVADVLGKPNRDSLPDVDLTATYAQGAFAGQLAMLTVSEEDSVAVRRPLTAEFATNPLRGRLRADSFDLGILAPLVPSVRALGGRLDGEVSVDSSRYRGELRLSEGTVSVPATGVGYRDISAQVSFSDEIISVPRMHVSAGGGRAELAGRLKPEADISARLEHFPVMNRRDFIEATASGELRVRGLVLSGRVRVDEGNAYLDKFLRSAGIDLSDPLYAQFIDTTVLERESFSLDTLQIDSVSVDLGDRFWLKSPDASIQLSGRLAVSTNAGGYRLEGTVTAVRGLYRLALAPGLTREFTIREGSIRYFGAPTTDAILDLTAEHLVRTAAGDEVTITAKLRGSLAEPTIALTSDVSPRLSETEIISYLVFGAPTMQAFLGREGETRERRSVFEQSAKQLVRVLSGKIESAVISQLGLPIDYFRINPGEVQSGLSGTELVLGMQVRILGFPSFLRASPRFCPREQLLSLDHVGINLETRISRQWGVATSIDPVQSCESVMAGAAARPYQWGFDVFWEKR